MKLLIHENPDKPPIPDVTVGFVVSAIVTNALEAGGTEGDACFSGAIREKDTGVCYCAVVARRGDVFEVWIEAHPNVAVARVAHEELVAHLVASGDISEGRILKDVQPESPS